MHAHVHSHGHEGSKTVADALSTAPDTGDAVAAGGGLFDRLFQVYVPRRECMFLEADVIWTHVLSDVLITASYFSIPIALVYFYRKREDLAFNWVFILFATFIFACGATHFFQTLAIWHPLYRLEGIVKAITAVASVGTASVLWPLIPKALALPSPAALRAANDALTVEIEERRVAQQQLHKAHDELEDRVRARTAELERLSRMKDEFLATLSHELRTPLNAILGWVTLMKEGQLDEHSRQEAIQVIDRNARTQTRLISDLLDMSRIISGKMHLEIRTIDLADVVHNAIETIRAAAEARQVQIETQFDQNLRPVLGDSDRLQQLVWNLLSNSVKFTPRSGWMRIALRMQDSRAEIIVSDNGAGIAPEILPYVFEKFRQAEQTTTRRFGGLGLGLAIVRQIAELHGGSVEAHSEGSGRGSTFIVRLPIAAIRFDAADAQSQAENDATKFAEAIDLSGFTVLVVDDEQDAADLVCRMLTVRGAHAIAASSVQEALEIFERSAPDLIVSDIGLPERDGFELIRIVRQRSSVPAIALTAFARPEDAQRAIDAGFQAHVPKPAEVAHLLTTVAALIKGRTQAQ